MKSDTPERRGLVRGSSVVNFVMFWQLILPERLAYRYKHLSPSEWNNFYREAGQISAYGHDENNLRQNMRKGMQVAKQADCKSVT